MSELATQTLQIVTREIGVALADARSALESHVEQPAGNAPLLDRCANELHQVQGALRVLEIYGAALLAEEMEQVARYLLATLADRKNQAESLDALMRAMVQLPGYLERVIAGGRDLALVLLPLLNDLRAVRGSSLLSEGTLLLLNLKSDRQAQPTAPAPGEPPLSVAQWARRLRARFQTGLVGWIRGERREQNLDILSAVATRLEQVATQQSVFQLWWVTGALLEALRENGVEGSVSVKRLLGLADREIKRLFEEGENRYAQYPPIELLNNLLYYIARATSAGPRVAAVRASFRLAELLPLDDSVEEERESLSAPSVKLMHTVAAAIREDLGRVKDVLDLFVRRAGGQVEELTPQIEMLRKIGDTLGVLGLGELRAQVQEATRSLEGMVAGRQAADQAALVQVAAMLIKVEDHLEEQLVGLILPKQALPKEGEETDQDFQQVQAAVLRECVVNLARVKESIAQNVTGTLDAAGFDTWPELMRGIKAGLLMLGKTRAVEAIEAVSQHLKRVMRPGGSVLSSEYLDRLADAIVSIEYYIETLQAGRTDPWYMLDNAQTCLDTLAREPEPVVPTVPALGAASYARTVRIGPPLTPTARALSEAETETTGRVASVPPVLVPATAAKIEPADPDLLRLFVEEAFEELARIEREFPAWDHNPLESDSLLTMRRSFHTLKGSGRMVGARDLGEFAWSIENLLNRLLEGTMQRSLPILETLRDAVKLLPLLVRDLQEGHAGRTDATAISARAYALAAGREGMLVLGAEPETAAPEPYAATQVLTRSQLPQPEPAPVPDAALREIYSRETASHVATIRQWLAREQPHVAPHVLSEEAFRASHTLAGSSKMAEVRHGIRLAEPLNRWLRKSFDSGIGLDDSGLMLLEECMAAMEAVAGHLDESTAYFTLHDTLRARIARAELELERRIAEAAVQSERSGVHTMTGALPASALLSMAASEPAPIEAAPDFDPDVAAIFCEEATELLEAAETALQQWNADPGSAAHVDALKRPLHTLKGGARMAGISAMGNLSHELESLIIQIGLGTAAGDERARSVVQQTLDELSRMRELVAAGRSVAPASALIERLHAAARGMSLPHVLTTLAPPAAVALHPPMDTAVVSAPLAAPDPSPLPELTSAWAPNPLSVDPLATWPAPEPVAFVSEPLSPSQTAEVPLLRAAAESLMPPPAVPPGREPVVNAERGEMARVSADLLDQLLNNAGEVSIARARIEQQVGAVEFNLGELSRTVTRLKEQLRKLELETETQILNRHANEAGHRADFDPLELDRYSSIQQFSRALAESVSDVASLQQLLDSLLTEAQNLLQQQGRTVTELQNGLMRTRMVPFQRHVQRLARIVRQAAADSGKQADLIIEGATGELDRQVLERMLPPFEHMLRNAVVHGIETPADRRARGKNETGQIRLNLKREGAEVVVELRDDGAGMNLNAIRNKGLALGLIHADQALSDEDVMQLVLEPGFSTADSLTQQAGRGVGMDVVATEIKKLGGALYMESTPGAGTSFTIKLPFTLAISHALVVRIADEFYALPLPTVEGVVRLSREDVAAHLRSDSASFTYGDQKYRLQPLAQFVGMEAGPPPDTDATIPVVLVRAGEHSTGLVADELLGSREIVVKPVGPQIASIRGISGATILSDGRVVIILDIGALVRAEWRGRQAPTVMRERDDQRTFVLVVDDSITVRRVTQRLLERNGMRVLTARDGMDAVAVLQEHTPDIILLDIEMPRMDGYEVASHVRSDPRLREVPIIMITSRVGEKHRARAIELGVDDYLGKPYQESQLIDAILPLVAKRRAALVAGGHG
jgi:chemosensory pili system protein ChpA (sensor histidine kinase/response regulator)